MAQQNESKKESTEILQLVSFNIGVEEFGVDILKVQEINKMIHITKVPNSPDFIEGVINLRGRVIPVIDLRTRMGMDRAESNKDTRIIIVEVSDRTVGFIVDAVNEVLRIPANITEPPPQMVTSVNAEYITGVGKLEDRLLLLLDLEKVLVDEEKVQLGETGA